MRIEEQIEIAAPRKEVWEYLSNPACYPQFMSGLTRWELAGERDRGIGARFRMLIQLGSAEVGGLIEIVEWAEERDIAWSSVTGVDQRGRWRLRTPAEGRTRVTFRFAYGIAGGGVPAMIAERVAARPLRRHFRRSLLNLKRAVEDRRLQAEVDQRVEAST